MKSGHGYCVDEHIDVLEMLSPFSIGWKCLEISPLYFSTCHEMWEICLTLVCISCRHKGQVSSCKAHSMHRSLKKRRSIKILIYGISCLAQITARL